MQADKPGCKAFQMLKPCLIVLFVILALSVCNPKRTQASEPKGTAGNRDKDSLKISRQGKLQAAVNQYFHTHPRKDPGTLHHVHVLEHNCLSDQLDSCKTTFIVSATDKTCYGSLQGNSSSIKSDNINCKSRPTKNPTVTPGDIKANGMTIHFQELKHSGKPPLILLHGGSLTSKSMLGFAQVAWQYYHVYLIDTRGHGQSDNPGHRPITYDLLAEDVMGFLTQKKIARPDIVGVSDGGITALTLALNYPKVPRAIVLYGAVPVERDMTHYTKGMVEFFGSDKLGQLSATDIDTIGAHSGVKEFLSKMHPKADPQYWRKMLSDFWPMWSASVGYAKSRLQHLKVKTLILLGDEDQFFTVEDAVRMKAFTSHHSTVRVVPDASHGFFKDTTTWKADIFNELVLRFLTPSTVD